MRRPTALTWYTILVVGTVIFSVVLTPSSKLLDFTQMDPQQQRLLSLIINIPYFCIWFTAFFAYFKLFKYADSIKKSKEGKAYRNIAKGTAILAWGLPATMLIGSIFSEFVERNHGLLQIRTIVDNYIYVIFPLIGFFFINAGSRSLYLTTKAKTNLKILYVGLYTFIMLGTLYTHFILSRSFQTYNPYFLSPYPLVLTVITPNIFTWFMGLLATYYLIKFSTNVKGLLYRRAISYLSAGLSLVVVSDVLSHYFESIFASTSTGFSSILLLVYSLLLLQTAGYILVAQGAIKLKRIEEV